MFVGDDGVNDLSQCEGTSRPDVVQGLRLGPTWGVEAGDEACKLRACLVGRVGEQRTQGGAFFGPGVIGLQRRGEPTEQPAARIGRAPSMVQRGADFVTDVRSQPRAVTSRYGVREPAESLLGLPRRTRSGQRGPGSKLEPTTPASIANGL